MRYGMMVILFVVGAMIVGCTTVPVQEPQDVFTKFMETQTKNDDAMNKKLDDMAKEQTEMKDFLEKLWKAVDNIKVVDTNVLTTLFDQMERALEFGRTSKGPEKQ
ncbi:hypothetical protein JW851_02285 [Candidatus Woesearchaeota archaeon]|nr:hypothetical protein [Candidatus Woesearchaeota archaeon]